MIDTRGRDIATKARNIRQARTYLREHWGYNNFLSGQREAVEAFLQNKDTMVLLPTGGGKSVCYQLPALLSEKKEVVLVVTPLIALMQDQVLGLVNRGIEATYINSHLPLDESADRWAKAERGEYQIIYISPEFLFSKGFTMRGQQLRVSLLAIDEAHCVSEWGHMFRPSYRRIYQLYPELGYPPVMAVTATANPRVRDDIKQQLALRDPVVIIRGFDRPNIHWSVLKNGSKRDRVRHVLADVRGSGIVYAATRNGVESWTRWLRQQGEEVVSYHAGYSATERDRAQAAWINDDARLVVATNAFGMGIDKKDVRFVIHVNMPSSLSQYYQEAGRAGRDGRPARAVLLMDAQDIDIHRSMVDDNHPSDAMVHRVYTAVCNLEHIALGELPDGPVILNMRKLAEYCDFTQRRVRAIINILAGRGVWSLFPAKRNQGILRFWCRAAEMREYAESVRNDKLARFVITLLRTIDADAFYRWQVLDVEFLVDRLGVKRTQMEKWMAYLEQLDILSWRNMRQTVALFFNETRTRRLACDDADVQRIRERAAKKLEEMVRYTQSTTCRRACLLTYFGEEYVRKTCDGCDVCRSHL